MDTSELDTTLMEVEQALRDDAQAQDDIMFVECCYEDYLMRQVEAHYEAESLRDRDPVPWM